MDKRPSMDSTPTPSFLSSGLLTGKMKRGEKPTEGRVGWVAQDEQQSVQSHPLWRTLPEKMFDIVDTAEAIGKTKGNLSILRDNSGK